VLGTELVAVPIFICVVGHFLFTIWTVTARAYCVVGTNSFGVLGTEFVDVPIFICVVSHRLFTLWTVTALVLYMVGTR
jgi:hypothetical protein